MRHCDIHAGYSELERCVRQSDYKNSEMHFITILRDPIRRYLSEYEHVKRGATWSLANRECLCMKIFTSKCYNKTNRQDVDVDWYLNCDYNLGNNRMVRMLPDYTDIGCNRLHCFNDLNSCDFKTKQENDRILLESAKDTLANKINFFAIAEYQCYHNIYLRRHSIIHSNFHTRLIKLKILIITVL